MQPNPDPRQDAVAEPAGSGRGRRWPWIAGLLAFVLLAGGGGAAVWRAAEGTSTTGAAARRTPAASADATTNATVDRLDAVGTLLAARSRAILTRDKRAFLALIDPTQVTFRAQQATIFDRIAKIPLASWKYDYAGEGPGLTAARKTQLSGGAWVSRVILHYEYAGGDSPVDREQYLTLVSRGGHWLLAGDNDGATSGLSGERDIWDLGPVTVVRGRSSLVIGNAAAGALRRYAQDADRSVRDVIATWKGRWNRRPVVIVPRTQADMAALIGSDGHGLDQIAAVTTGYSVSGPTRGDRVVINPAAYKSLGDLGRRVVMSHELTHVATRASTYRSVPIWMSEGFADYVAYQAVQLPVRVVAADVLGRVRAGKGPRHLPGDADFDASRGDLAPAYEGAWLACRMITAQYGEQKLISLYAAFADRQGGLPENDIRRVLGISEARLVSDWQAYLKRQARR